MKGNKRRGGLAAALIAGLSLGSSSHELARGAQTHGKLDPCFTCRLEFQTVAVERAKAGWLPFEAADPARPRVFRTRTTTQEDKYQRSYRALAPREGSLCGLERQSQRLIQRVEHWGPDQYRIALDEIEYDGDPKVWPQGDFETIEHGQGARQWKTEVWQGGQAVVTDAGSCAATMAGGQWAPEECGVVRWEADRSDSAVAETAVTWVDLLQRKTAEDEVLGARTHSEVLTQEYTTDELIEQLGEDASASSWGTAWEGEGMAALWLSPAQRWAVGQSMRYRFALRTERGGIYRVFWEEVSRFDDGTVESVPRMVQVDGDGKDQVTKVFSVPVPARAGCVTVEGVRVAVVAGGFHGVLDYGGRAPGSGGPSPWEPEGCAGCQGSPTSAPAIGAIPDFGISLGRFNQGRSDGCLWLGCQQPERNWGAPEMFQVVGSPGIEVVEDQDRIQQVRTPEVLVDLEHEGPGRFQWRFFPKAQAGPKTDGRYVGIGEPAVIWQVRTDRDGQNASLEITEIRGAKRWTYKYDYQAESRTWTLLWPEAVRQDSSRLEYGPAEREIWTEMRGRDGQVEYRECRIYRRHEWGEGLAELRQGQGECQRTTRLWYIDGPFAQGSPQPLRNIEYPDGGWERFEYDDQGRLSRVIQPWADADADSSPQECHVWELDYASPSGSGDDPQWASSEPRRVIERVQGIEVGRTYTIHRSGPQDRSIEEIRCPEPGLEWNDPRCLRRLLRSPVDGPGGSIRHEDGTLTQWSERTEGDHRIVESATGRAGGIDGAVDQGIRITHTIDSGGAVVQRSVERVRPQESICLHQQIAVQRDEWGRPTRVESLGGRLLERGYHCCGIEWEKDLAGAQTIYLHDPAHRLVGEVAGSGVVRRVELNAIGQAVAEQVVGTNGVALHSGGWAYDTAGEWIRYTNAWGEAVHRSLSAQEQIIRYPDGSQQREVRYADGRLARIDGTAAFPVRFEYGVERFDGIDRVCEREIRLAADGADTAEVRVRYRDGLGRLVGMASGGEVQRWIYNELGQRIRSEAPSTPAQLLAYDPEGRLESEALDLNRNGKIDWEGPDRIRRWISEAVLDGGRPAWRTEVSEWRENGSRAPTLVSREIAAADGTGWRIEERESISIARIEWGAPGQWMLWIDGSTGIEENRFDQGRWVERIRRDGTGAAFEQESGRYDPWDRLEQVVDGSGGIRSWIRNSAGQAFQEAVQGPGRVPLLSWQWDYDGMGRATRATGPDGASQFLAYQGQGLVSRQWGRERVDFEYDAQGRMRGWTTWQSADAGQARSALTWDPISGLPAGRWDPDPASGEPAGPGFAYSYDASGRLTRVIGPRGGKIDYAYGPGGELSSVRYGGIQGPDAEYRYDRAGRLMAVEQAGSRIQYAWDSQGRLARESHQGGPLDQCRIEWDWQGDDVVRRRLFLGDQLCQAIAYEYDTAGRLAEIRSGDGLAVRYTYDPASGRVSQAAGSQAGNQVWNSQKEYDGLGRTVQIQAGPWKWQYAYDRAGRRSMATAADGSRWEYGYDARGQLIRAERFWADGTAVAGQRFQHLFDDLGNRIDGYRVNRRNQVEGRQTAALVSVRGLAALGLPVWVNGQMADRQGEYFHSAIALPHGAYPEVEVTTGTAGPVSSGRVYRPAAWETFEHDAEGNRTRDGRWEYAWDGAGRLAAMRARAEVPAGVRLRLEFEYDAFGRRIAKRVYPWDPAQNDYAREPRLERRWIYDGWTVAAELDGTGSVLATYGWGLDRDGTMGGGARGAGGLLWSRRAGQTLWAAMDAGGNVAGWVRGADATAVGHREYGPFGEPIRIGGGANECWGFSTQIEDAETGFYYYGHRYYDPDAGRWLSADPAGESAG